MIPFPVRAALAVATLAGALGAQAQLPPADRGPPPSGGAPAVASSSELEQAGRVAAHAWLVLLDRRDWGTAWDTAGAAFRQTVPLANWMDAVPRVRLPFGTLLEREAIETSYKTSLPGRPDGHYVSVLFNSRFDKRLVQEIVTTVREPDGRLRVIGYNPTPR